MRNAEKEFRKSAVPNDNLLEFFLTARLSVKGIWF